MSLPWLRTLWVSFVQARNEQRLAHAHCLPWRPDLGMDKFTPELLRLLLCQQPNVSRACGECKSCKLQKASSHPDYYELASQDGKVISVDAIRELVTSLSQTANQQGNKVVWIRDAEKMSTAAANALLKTLEEPSAATYFILSPERTERLLPTLRSRMRLHRVPEPSTETVTDWLAQQLKRVLSQEELLLVQKYRHQPVYLLNWLSSGQIPENKMTQLREAIVEGKSLPELNKQNWLEWSYVTERFINDLMKVSQRFAKDALLDESAYEQLQLWLERRQLTITMLSKWRQACYAIRQQGTEQTGLNAPLLLQELWVGWQQTWQQSA